MITINDVAKEAGVSKSTVSSVLSGKRPISKEVSNHVIEVAKKLNYRPNYLARSLATKETKIIGLNMYGEKLKFSQFHLLLLNGVLKVCYENGYRVLVNQLPFQHNKLTEFQATDPVDGEILLDPSENDYRILDRLERKIPMVIIGRPSDEYEGIISYVDNDNMSIAAKLTQHLIELGHRNILFLNSSKFRTVSQDREDGYKIAHENVKQNINVNYIVYKPDEKTSVEYGYDYTREMLSENKDITAIIADSDKVARGVYDAIKELGFKDISVAAFSDDSESRFSPSLTCVNLNAEQLGIEAANILIDKCTHKTNIYRKLIIPSNVILRDSTKRYSNKS